MKRNIYILLLLIFSSSSIASVEESIQLEKQMLTVSMEKINYSSFDNLLLPNGLSIPYQSLYIPLTENSITGSLTAESISSELVATFDKIDYSDIPTSSDPQLYSKIVSSIEFDKLGSKQLHMVEKVRVNEIDYLKCILFPVTIDENGKAYFHSESVFKFGNHVIDKSIILTTSQFKNRSRKIDNTKSTSTSASYLIITSEYLKESFEQLANYKNEIGISTEIKLIEDILPFYTGRDDAEKLREYLKEFYANGGQYLLLGGDETILPIRYTYHNLAFDTIALENQQVCDLYFADLTGNWNADNDQVWGEKYSDSADLSPELFVGRLPFDQPFEVTQYIEKLIQYETNKNIVDLSYLEKTFFFSSDQMRDYGASGQHGLIADAFPSYFEIDTTNGVEQSSGDSPSPTNKISKEVEPILSDGFGIVNILAHGSSMTFEVKTANYNEWPKSYFTTDSNYTESGVVSNLDKNNKLSLYVSLGCDNGAFDKDQTPFNHLYPSIVETLLSQEKSGAVAFIANTRWGWVSTSHLLQKRFIEYLFANENQSAIISLHQMKDDFYYYRDLVYGINYFGDPTMVVYTREPKTITIDLSYQQANVIVTAMEDNHPLENCNIFLSENNNIVATYTTDVNGQIVTNYPFNLGATYKFSALKDGFTINQSDFVPSIATDINDETDISLPTSFELAQNYPNPFNPSTTIRLSLPNKSEIELIVLNILGQEVKTLANGSYSAGRHNFEWDGKDNNGAKSATGVYFYRIETSEFVDVKKMVLLK